MGKKNKKGKKKGQRMAGEVWRDYDAASHGSASFDKADIEHLTKEGWSVNDIRKAALAADHVSNTADKHLRTLGEPGNKYFKQRGFGGMAEHLFGGSLVDAPLQWNGRDGDGRGLALGGNPLRKHKTDSAKSWALPKDFVEKREQAEFNRRMDAWNAANPKEESAATPAPAIPEAPAFDPGSWMTPSSSSSTEKTEEPKTAVSAPVAPSAPTMIGGTADFTKDFQEVVNRRHGRDRNWAGDVWKQ